MKFSLFSKSAKAALCARAGRNNRKRQSAPPSPGFGQLSAVAIRYNVSTKTAYALVEGFRIGELARIVS